jgi:hypothetical protein
MEFLSTSHEGAASLSGWPRHSQSSWIDPLMPEISSLIFTLSLNKSGRPRSATFKDQAEFLV